MAISLLFAFAGYFTFTVWPLKYKVMTYYGFFYGSFPMFGLGIPYGLYKGGVKRLVAILMTIIVVGSIGWLASKSEKEGMAKVDETYLVVYEMGYILFTG